MELEWTLELINDGFDLVLVRHKDGMAMGALHIASFATEPCRGELYDLLTYDRTARVKVVLAE